MRLPDPRTVAIPLRREAERAGSRAVNSVRHLSGVARPALAQTPHDTIWRWDKTELWRYRSAHQRPGPAVMIVSSLVSRSYVFDLAPGNSVVERLMSEGLDVFLLDWGVPDEMDAGNTLETYCDRLLPAAIRAATQAAAVSVVSVFAYCFGAVLSLLAIAGNPTLPVGALVTLAAPVDFSSYALLGSLDSERAIDPEDLIDDTGNVPASLVHAAIRSLQPFGELTARVNLWQNLWSREYLAAHQRMTHWAGEHVPFPGAVFRQSVDLFGKRNLLTTGRVPLGSRTVDLADVQVPLLSVTAERDRLVPPAISGDLGLLVGSRVAEELRLPGGHVGLIVGRGAQERNIPAVSRWIRRQDGLSASVRGPHTP
jgi:polyhydroxyalkanoate synthase